MSKNSVTPRLLTGAATIALAAIANPAMAQGAPPTQDQATVDSTATTPTDEPAIVVTGTLLSRTEETPSPVTVLTQESLVNAGITNVNEAIRSVSADSSGSISTGFQNGFSGGGAAVSLRGLGVSSTLILIDGLRSANFPLNDDGHNAYVDLNSIPFGIIDRVEVLKDGASSTYGADAIGGVVNLILRKHYQGIGGMAEGGVTQRGDGGHERVALNAGFGDYEASGFNFYLSGEYQHDGAIRDRGFPYNTSDLSSIGGLDNNTADSSITSNTSTAVVTRVTQSDLNNPLSGMIGSPLTNQYQLLNPAACQNGTFTVNTASAVGTGCKHDLIREYGTILPDQQRWGVSARVSMRLSDNIEGYVSAIYSHSDVFNVGRGTGSNPGPNVIRATQPFGGSPSLASSNPGIVLPVYICSAGVNCATAGDRQLNPNNPFAAAYANDPKNGAARIYYQFGDIPFNFTRKNELYRFNAGLSGNFADSWDWRIEGVYARDNFAITDRGYIKIANLLQAINTGAYNFVNPELNTDAVRQFVSPDRTTDSHSTLASLDASISHAFAQLAGGPLQAVVGGQIRRETLENNSRNADLSYYTLTTSSAFGKHTVTAGFFEIDAPILESLDVNVSGRYDHYSEGFSHFSPKVGVKFDPVDILSLRGTYSQGFRAPTFGENGPLSQFAGCSTFTPPASFTAAHGGSSNSYANAYSLCSGLSGNPALKPEKSRSFTLGAIVKPTHWFKATVDYYNVKKTDTIVSGPLGGAARNAYFSAATAAAGCAAVAAIGQGYSCNTVDAVDPLFPNALPRILIINTPFVNAGSIKTSGIDISAQADFDFGADAHFTSRLDVTDILKYDLDPGDGSPVQKFVGTLGPYELSSGAGTPKWRGNWQNTLTLGQYSLTATANYVSHIKEVAADEGPTHNLSCEDNLYGTGDQFCYIKSFITVDLHAAVNITDDVNFYLDVANLFDAKAPIAPASYSGTNYLPTWHLQGVVGREYKAGINFKF
ncbi:MAG: TonB-dependent receptor [Tsuneonella sp.]